MQSYSGVQESQVTLSLIDLRKGRMKRMEYTTQMDAARKGIITEAMKQVADYENMSVETIRDLVAKGQVAIPANKNHTESEQS